MTQLAPITDQPLPETISKEGCETADTGDTAVAVALIRAVARAGAAGYSNQVLVDGEFWTVTARKEPSDR